jgi:hypothetical protein
MLASLAISSLSGADPKISASDLQFFESKIRPVLADNCYKCHSEGSEKLKGGLLLDTRDGVRKGGNTGPAVVPGNLDKSLLIQAVRYKDKDLQMPPNDRMLSASQIADLEAWVKMGAPDPRTAGSGSKNTYVLDMEKGKKHWAYQPVKKPEVPQVSDPQGWVKTPVDSFILAALQAHNLTPSPQADKVTLIRRANFDLIGLPPTPKEVDEFVADTSPDAFQKVIDRLLKSERYGERWGRYWLDLAHYGNTDGRDGNNRDPRYLYAHTYRDYVIRSFNEDLPYDRFILEQIAADKLPIGDDKRPLAALGFITLGRKSGQRDDIIDDHIDVVSKSTMAMTATCARCHDHKFDPIPTRDYYSLHGIFASSVEPKEGPLLEPVKETPAYLAFQKELAAREAAVESFKEQTLMRLSYARATNSGAFLAALYDFKHRTNDIARNAFMNKRGLNPQNAAAWDGLLRNVGRRGNPVLTPWLEFSQLEPKEFATKSKELSAKFYANKDSKINPLVARLFVTPPATIYQVAARYTMLFTDIEKRWQSTLSTYEARKRSATDPPPTPTALPEAPAEEVRKVFYAKSSPLYLDDGRVDQYINRNNNLRNDFQRLQRLVNDTKLSHPGSPPRAQALEDSEKPRDSFVMLRGNPGSKGPVVPRQFFEVLSNGSRQPFKNGSGRLELAKAIASADNPLTARVMANRIWLHHFGEGFVKTPDDFGTRSEPPSHPELLDYLAVSFVENGWSIKMMHRLIMLSAVYQQSSDDNPRLAQLDPENKWVWQMNRRRLDFEALRDTILAIGGKLDLTMGGPSVRLNSEPYSTRRSVYGYVDRNNMPNMLLAFDFANPDLTTGKRETTIVPQQALFMMNSPLVVEQARDLVRRDDFKALTRDEDRLALLYRLIYQRKPSEIEQKLAFDYVQSESQAGSGDSPENAWEYGTGQYDPAVKQVKNFSRITTFSNGRWQLVPQRVRGEQRNGLAGLTPQGGVTSREFSAIRRWTAPRDGFISIDAVLSQQPKATDTVVGCIVSSRSGFLGVWNASSRPGTTTRIPRLMVKRGDTIDFVATTGASGRGAQFGWSPAIQMEGGGALSKWNAGKDFTDGEAGKRLGAWEKFAQVMLETNEMSFIN